MHPIYQAQLACIFAKRFLAEIKPKFVVFRPKDVLVDETHSSEHCMERARFFLTETLKARRGELGLRVSKTFQFQLLLSVFKLMECPNFYYQNNSRNFRQTEHIFNFLELLRVF